MPITLSTPIRRHSHDYYVISLIGRGRQTFMHGGSKHFTPPGGVILINPQSVHTGEPADANGFELRSIYPTAAAMQQVVGDLTGDPSPAADFKELRVDDQQVTAALLGLHQALIDGTDALEYETRFIQTMALLVKRYADVRQSITASGASAKPFARRAARSRHGYADGSA